MLSDDSILDRPLVSVTCSLQDTTWLRDEDAVKFQDWMEYWESEEGKEKGGPPKENLFVDVRL